jgi:Cu2+-exporting ATPase
MESTVSLSTSQDRLAGVVGEPSFRTPAAHSAGVADRLAALDEPEELARFTRWEAGDDGERLGVSGLQLSGMHCAACAGIIESALCALPGVRSAHVNASAQRASVRWDPRQVQAASLIRAVRAAGYDAAPDVALEARELRRQEHRSALWRLFVSSFLAMQVMMLATPSYVAGPSDLSDDLRQLLNWGSWVLSVPVLWFAGGPFLRAAWRSVRIRRIGMDVPVSLGIVVTFVASTGATFDPAGAFGHEVYFDSMTMFLAFLWLGRFLEVRTRHHAADALEAALQALPATAQRVLPDGQTETVSIHRLRPGDVVRVPRGEALPADGRLLGAAADVSEALITGEAAAVTRQQGEGLLAGSLNAGAPFEMLVERVGADTRHEAIVALMREALSQRPAAARLADRWAGPFLWGVLLLAAGSAAVWSVLDPARALWIAVAVLVVTCPCALWLATPSTLVAAAGGLARRGVLLRRLDALEAMARVEHVFLDKTGSLTEDRLHGRSTALAPQAPQALRRLAGTPAASLLSDEDVALAVAASLARWSRHPVSMALAEAAPAASADGVRWSTVIEVPGGGLEARDPDGHAWRLGSRAWVMAAAQTHEHGTPFDTVLMPDVRGSSDLSMSSMDRGAADRAVLGRDGCVVAVFDLDEALRPDALSAVRVLRDDGLTLTLLSGDMPTRAHVMAGRLGLDDVQAGVDPAGKLEVVRQARSSGRCVAMLGDGLNDAPVLAAADVSIAMGHAALAARQGADAVLSSGRVHGLVDLRLTAKRTVAIVRQNMAWSVIYNLSCIPLAMVGWMPPWAAGLGMAASSLAVILNAQRAARDPRPGHSAD